MNEPSSQVEVNLKSKEAEDTNKIKKGLVFTIVAIALLMTTVDATIVATALDTLQKDLNTDLNWAGWILTGYSLGLVLMLPISAQLSIRYGHRKVFLYSVVCFTIASILCGLSDNITLIITLRIIQAFGGAGITPSVTGIIVEHFGHSRDRAVSLFGSIFPVGSMIGPILGGIFVTYWTWRGIFFINAPLGVAVIFLALKYIPKDTVKKDNTHQQLDFTGIIWLAVGLIAAMFAASFIGEENTNLLSFTFIGLVIIACFAFIVFFYHIEKVKQPFINPLFIHGKGFGSVNLLNFIFSGGTIGMISLVPIYAVNHYGISPLNSGTLLTAEGIASVVLSATTTMLLRRTGYRLPLYIGCSFLIIGLTLLSLEPQFGFSPFLWLATASFFVGIGIGINSPPARNAGLQLAPTNSATIAAIRTLGIQMGQIFMIAIATAVIADSKQPGITQSNIYLCLSLILLIALPLISKIPEHKGAW